MHDICLHFFILSPADLVVIRPEHSGKTELNFAWKWYIGCAKAKVLTFYYKWFIGFPKQYNYSKMTENKRQVYIFLKQFSCYMEITFSSGRPLMALTLIGRFTTIHLMTMPIRCSFVLPFSILWWHNDKSVFCNNDLVNFKKIKMHPTEHRLR